MKNFFLEKKIYLQIGPYTSIGGVSIHIFRLSNLLKSQFDIRFINESREASYKKEVFNIRDKNILRYFREINNSNVVHIHTGIWWLRCFHILSSRVLRKKIIVTIHSLSNLQTKASIELTRFFLKFVDKTIVVSKEISQTINVKNQSILPAFLPPKDEDQSSLPENILKILNENNKNKIIVSNAFDLIVHQGFDLYGLDLLIDVARFIKKEKKNYKIIFILGSLNKNIELYSFYKETIKNESLENQIVLIQQTIPFVSLISESDLVVRATNTDGDAITIREALYLKKNVIASDVVERPLGTVLFKNRDSKDLYLKINECLLNEKKSTLDYDLIDKFESNYLDTILDKLNL